eukprot:gene6588-biopygen1379
MRVRRWRSAVGWLSVRRWSATGPPWVRQFPGLVVVRWSCLASGLAAGLLSFECQPVSLPVARLDPPLSPAPPVLNGAAFVPGPPPAGRQSRAPASQSGGVGVREAGVRRPCEDLVG